MNNIPANVHDVALLDHSKIQIIESLKDLPRARKHQYAAFIRDECTLLVWADQANRVIDVARTMEKKMIELIWDDGDSIRRYEKIPEDGDVSRLETGYTPPKRERVIIQPLIIAGVPSHQKPFFFLT